MSAPCEVWFYHLERSGLDQVLPELLEKTLQRGWRALVRSPEPDRIEHLDGWLWTYRDDSFLPHGRADEPEAARQPILLTTDLLTTGPLSTGEGGANRAHALFLIDGAEAGSLDGFERCILLFDGRDDAALARARDRWKAVRAAGHPASYWRQAERGWEKQA